MPADPLFPVRSTVYDRAPAGIKTGRDRKDAVPGLAGLLRETLLLLLPLAGKRFVAPNRIVLLSGHDDTFSAVG